MTLGNLASYEFDWKGPRYAMRSFALKIPMLTALLV
jgi:hypothetical protein